MHKLITLCFLFATLQVTAQVQIPTIGEEKIAPAFPDENSILVVLKYSKKSINKYLEKGLENYAGEYRLLAPGESLSPKDTARVRFFVMAVSRSRGGEFVAGGREGPSTEYQLVMTDRKTNMMYYSKDASSCFGCVFADYFKKLEKLRASVGN